MKQSSKTSIKSLKARERHEEGATAFFMASFLPSGAGIRNQGTVISEDDSLEQLWRELASIDGDGSAAREMLEAGIPIYYCEQDTPPGLQIKKYPGGRRELVKFSRQGDEVISVL